MSPSYWKRLKQKRIERSRKGVEAKERKRRIEAAQWHDVGGFVTDGILGKHNIRLLAKDDEDRWMAIEVDGIAKRPRTMAGIKRCMAEMLWGKVK